MPDHRLTPSRVADQENPRNDDDRLRAWMQSAQAGDSAAYARLLEDLTPRLRRMVYFRRRFLSPEDIEDIVQDILLSLHAVRATYDPRRPFMPWLLAIVRNRTADAARRYVRRSEKETAVDDLEVTFTANAANSSIDTAAGMARHLDAESERRALANAIRRLPAGQKHAIEMLKLEEMSLREAAAASGMSVGALKVATHRAIGSLRRIMSKND